MVVHMAARWHLRTTELEIISHVEMRCHCRHRYVTNAHRIKEHDQLFGSRTTTQRCITRDNLPKAIEPFFLFL
jgi:hypothetical protein